MLITILNIFTFFSKEELTLESMKLNYDTKIQRPKYFTK